MTSRREEERNEKIIRGLMKLPPNRRCINCNSLGPQYVCTDFWTFVCTTCSGIHREFTHRVKSVSMAKFTSQEVDALQKGGNQRAKDLFLKAWDSQKNRLPDNSNIDKVRHFIKNVYVDKMYSSEKSFDRPPRDPQTIRSPEDHMRRASSCHSYSQSPPYDFQYEERQYGNRTSGLTRKPGSDRGHYAMSLSSFVGPRNSTGRQNEDSFSNDGLFGRASDNSVSGGTPRDGVGNASEKTLHPQRASSVDGSSMLFKSINSLHLSENGFTGALKRSSSTSLQCSLFPRSLDSSESEPRLTPSAQQKLAPKPLTGANEIEQSPIQGIQKSSVNSFSIQIQQQTPASDVIVPDTGGWAVFDVPQNAAPVVKEINPEVPSSDGVTVGNFSSFPIINQSSSHHDHYPSAAVDAFGLEVGQKSPSGDTHLWNAFGEQANENNGLDAGFQTDSHIRPSEPLSSNFIRELNFPVHSLANNPKPTNPFALPDDSSEVESSSTFWDMSSLPVAALPPSSSSSFMDHSWFPESFAGGVCFDHPANGSTSLGFVAAAGLTQIPNIHAHAQASSKGGNPFA